MKRLMLVAVAGLTILAWRMYASDAGKSTTTTTAATDSSKASNNHESNGDPTNTSPQAPTQTSGLPFATPKPAASKQVVNSVSTPSIPTPPAPISVEKPTKLIMTPPPVNSPAPAAPKTPSAPAGASLSPAVNFQMQMAQIHQKVFSDFAQPDLMEFAQALEQAFNGALATKEFDKGVSKLEEAVKVLAISFGRNIEVNGALHSKIKKAFNTATAEFETLVRSGKIADLSGENYLARILKAALFGLTVGFSEAQVVPENTPVPANLGEEDHNNALPGMPNESVINAPKVQSSANLTIKAPLKPSALQTSVPTPSTHS